MNREVVAVHGVNPDDNDDQLNALTTMEEDGGHPSPSNSNPNPTHPTATQNWYLIRNAIRQQSANSNTPCDSDGQDLTDNSGLNRRKPARNSCFDMRHKREVKNEDTENGATLGLTETDTGYGKDGRGLIPSFSETSKPFEPSSVNIPIDGDYSLIRADKYGTNSPAEHRVAIINNPFDESTKRKFDVNFYASKKSAANGLLDLALLMANASQLKHMILTDGDHRFYAAMMSLLVISICLQLIVGLMLLFLAKSQVSEDESNEDIRKRTRKADILNNWVVAFVFVLTVVNVFIASFGLNDYQPSRDRRLTDIG